MRGPGDILGVAARRYGDKTALITAGRSFGYAELDDLAARAARGLRAAGVRPGQVVSLYGPNSWQWVLAYHAILRAAAVVNPINVMLTPRKWRSSCVIAFRGRARLACPAARPVRAGRWHRDRPLRPWPG
jgi:acyl-CoA synthetase (AMP-forming)/AMP-acid ligase II